VSPRLWILAGPNGAGKTTYARANLRDFIAHDRFINADEVARTLSPDNPEAASLAAGRKVLELRAELVQRRESFAVETTLATRTLLRVLEQARVVGFEVELTFLALSNVDLCVERVARRVIAGGHFIPTDVIVRRYSHGLRLLPTYLDVCDVGQVMCADAEPFPVATKGRDGLKLHDPAMWKALLALSGT
jgi:predicted ABC-type ATPase